MSSRTFKRLSACATALAGIAAVTAIATPVQPASAQALSGRPGTEVVLSIGQGQLITLPTTMSDIFIANDQIADVQVKSTRQVYVFGKAGGETTLYASNSKGDVVYAAVIRVGANISSVGQMLTLAIPDANINVNTMNGLVLLTGTVKRPEDAAEAERLVQAFTGKETEVVSRLRTATPLQVNLQVRFAEVSRSLTRELGTNLTSVDSSGGFSFGVGRGRNAVTFADDGSATFNFSEGQTTLAAVKKLLGVDIGLAFDLAERVGLVTTLSQPNLTALSGETASFLAGGEFPIPVSSGLGNTSVQYKDYGVKLDYTPVVLSNGRISMRVRPEVSEISSVNSVTIDNYIVPAISTRRAETTIELGSGQSFVIAGLLSNNSQNAIDKAPGLGDVPVLGNLFRSTSFRKGETELVIVVTPYLVEPVNASDIVLPTDGYRNADLAEQLLLFKENAGKSGAKGVGPTLEENAPAEPDLGMLPELPPATAPQGPKVARAETRKDGEADPAAPGFSF